MRLSAVIRGIMAVLLAAPIAQADETPPPATTQTPPPAATQPAPPTAVQSVPPEDAGAILGQRVSDPDGKDVGRLVDVLVDASGQPQAAVIDFGGFMGVGNRKVAVQWSALRFAPGDPRRPITLELAQDQIKAAPEYADVAKPAQVVIAPPAQPTPSQ